jgi:hypothetical protein
MTAPAGHVTVVVVPAPVPELHAVEYSCPGEGVTDGLARREADTDELAGREADTERLAGREADTERLDVTEADTERLADVEPDAAALSPGVLDTDSEAARDRDVDGLADALTRLHCT